MFILYFLAVILVSNNLVANADLSFSNCGKRPFENINNKVVNGFKAIPGDWGWSVSITNNGRHFCGGVLISDRHVITAAHCFGGLSTINPGHKIDIGVHNRNAKESWVETRSIKKLFIHEQFSMQHLRYDIAFIHLSDSITLNEYKVPACFDENLNNTLLDPQGKIGWLTGWGHEYYQGTLTIEKMQGFFSILSDNSCRQKYGTVYNTTIQICAGEIYSNAGACQGDSGGPFVIKSQADSKWYLVGLISWGYGCGQGTVFTRVKHFLPWINNKMAL